MLQGSLLALVASTPPRIYAVIPRPDLLLPLNDGESAILPQ